MYIIGLTGGIGSGKSTVADLFKQHDVTVIDADDMARQLCEPGQEAYQAIIEHFGTDILQSNGSIDRSKLRQHIFDQDLERQWLEALLHPMIRRHMMTLAEDSESPYTILMIPLLTESNNFDGIDRILVVDVPETIQIARACERDHVDEMMIRKMMAAQNSREARLSYADDVIQNDEDLENLVSEVGLLHQMYLKLSNNQ